MLPNTPSTSSSGRPVRSIAPRAASSEIDSELCPSSRRACRVLNAPAIAARGNGGLLIAAPPSLASPDRRTLLQEGARTFRCVLVHHVVRADLLLGGEGITQRLLKPGQGTALCRLHCER